jgi:hypothetical protein
VKIYPRWYGHVEKMPKGHHRRAVYHSKMTAVISCHICGTRLSLINHKITADGVITPSVVCVTPGCLQAGPQHEEIKLGMAI